MPFKYPWDLRTICANEEEVEVFLDDQKSRLVKKSQLETCTVCVPNADRHEMRYIMYGCNSSKCQERHEKEEQYGGEPCDWYLQVQTCQECGRSKIFQLSTHLESAASPTHGKLNLQMKRVVREQTERNMKPSDILNILIDRFKLKKVDGLLRKIQSLHGFHKTNCLGDNNFHDEMLALAASYPYAPDLDELVAFLYGYNVNQNGGVHLGTGTPDDPLLIGCTTKRLISRLRWASDYPLHVDSTYKLSSFGYPVFVVGVSDYARQFHPIAFFLTSDTKQAQIQQALQSTLDLYQMVTGNTPNIRMFMADADMAERNACEAVKVEGERPSFKMCWFHVMKNVKQLCTKIPVAAKRIIYHHIYRIHYSRDLLDFEATKEAALCAWKANRDCVSVAEHIEKQWLSGRFAEWQCFTSPPGYAKTNNPLETFDANIKSEYTKHNLTTLNCLLKLLMKCAGHRSVREMAFATQPRPSVELIKRYKKLRTENAFTVTTCSRVAPAPATAPAHRSSIAFLLHDSEEGSDREEDCANKVLQEEEGVYFVHQRGTITTHDTGARPGTHEKLTTEEEEALEWREQPMVGWQVHVEEGRCECRSWLNSAYCVHLIACRVHLGLHVEGLVLQRTKFVNKRKKKQNGQKGPKKGRARRVGPALSKE